MRSKIGVIFVSEILFTDLMVLPKEVDRNKERDAEAFFSNLKHSRFIREEVE